MTHATTDTILDQLISVRGVDDGGLRRRRLSDAHRRGDLLRVDRGVYLDPRTWLAAAPWTRHRVAAAAHAMSQPEAVFCRETALALHGLPLLRTPESIHVRTASRSNTGRRPPRQMVPSAVVSDVLTRWHHFRPGGRPLEPRDLCAPAVQKVLVSGGAGRRRQPFHRPSVPCGPYGTAVESLPHVLGDTLPRIGPSEAAVILDAARSSTQCGPAVTREELDEAMLPWASTAALRRADRAWRCSDPLSESPGESVSRIRMLEAGFEAPVTQHEIVLPDGRITRVDFLWPEAGVLGEFDGLEKYTRSAELSGMTAAEVVAQEKIREDALRALGYRIVRWTWRDLRDSRRLTELLVLVRVPRPHLSRAL